jgi:GNAT superfamily N-acetyltransferase
VGSVYRLSAMTTDPTVRDRVVTARRFDSDDEAGVLDVLRAVFGEWPRGIRGVSASEFFHWKHLDGPFGPSGMVVAEAAGKVVGFVAYMPWRFKAGGRTVQSVRGVDLAVHPAYRLRGVSVALRRESKISSDVSFIWTNPNVESRPGGRKVGRRPVRVLAQFVQLRPSVARIVARVSAGRSQAPRHLSVEAEPAAAVIGDELFTPLLDHAGQAGDRLATAKTVDYLRWRYGRFDDYHAVRVESGGTPRGFAIFRCRLHGSYWVTHVCELLVEPVDTRAVHQLLDRVRHAAPTDIVRCGFASRAQAASHGFFHYRARSLLATTPLHPNIVPDPTRGDSWALSVGDLELL